MTFTSSKSRTIVGLAVAAALAAPMTASAVATQVDFRKASPDALKVAKELLATQVTTINNVVAYIPVPMTANYSVGGANSFYMTVTLSAGLTAKNSPNLACKTVTATSAINTNVATLQSGGAGKSSFTFAIKTGVTLAGNASTGFCYLASGVTAIAFGNSGATSKTIGWKSTRVVGGSNVSVTAAAKSFITFTKGASASISVGSTGGLINVASNSMKLTSGSSKPASDLVSVAGIVKFNSVTGVVGATAAQTVFSTGFAKSATLVIAGDPIATSKKVMLGAGAAYTCSGGAGAIASAVASSGKVTFSGAKLTSGLSAGVKVCLVFSGTSAITAGQVTAVLGTKNAATLGYNPDFSFSPDNNMLNLKKNGRSGKVFNLAPLPAAGAATYDVSNLRFTNLGSANGTVRGTLYKGDGTLAATGVLVAATEFPKYGSVNLTFEQILTKLGASAIDGTAPTGAVGNYKRPWLQIDGEVSDMTIIHAITRFTNGTPSAPINMSATVSKE